MQSHLSRPSVGLGTAAAVALAFLISPQAARSQEATIDSIRPGRYVGGNAVSVGVVSISAVEFNRQLKASSLPMQPSVGLTVGYGAYAMFGPVLVGANGHAMLARTTVEQGWRSKAGGGYGLVDLGYAIVKRSTMMLAVMGGVGGSSVTTRLQQQGTREFADVLSQPAISLDLAAHTWNWHSGVKAELRRSRQGMDAARLLSIEAGYIGRIGTRTTWRTDVDAVRNGPAASLGGLYLRVSLGSAIKARRDALVPSVVSLLPFVGR